MKLHIVLFLMLFVQQVFSSVDGLQLAVDDAIQSQLRWDNVQGGDEWLGGVKPVEQEGEYRFLLQPAESLSVLVNKDAWLRMIAPQRSSDLNDIQVYQSFDGRLFYQQALELPEQENNRLLKPASRVSIVRIENSSSHAVSIALYTSRSFIPSVNIQYKDTISLPLEKEGLQIIPDAGWQEYYFLPENEQVSFSVQGPTRIAINLRRPMDKDLKVSVSSFLDVKMGGKATRRYDLEFKEDVFHAIRIAGQRQSVSAPLVEYVNVPDGEHEISIRSASDVYIQLHGLSPLFWSAINIPKAVSWLNTESLYEQDAISFMDALERRLTAISKDNMRYEGALEALNELDSMAGLSLPRQYAVNRLKEKIKSRYTRNQVLMPAPGKTYIQRSFRYLKSSLKYSDKDEKYYLSHKFFRERLRSIPQSEFYQLSDDELKLTLASTTLDSELELLVYSQQDEDMELWLQTGEQPKHRLKILQNHLSDRYLSTSIRQKIIDESGCCESIYGGLAADNGSLPLVRVASFSLPAGSLDGDIRLWVENNNGKKIWVSVQQRRPKKYQLSENQYDYLLQRQQDAGMYFLSSIKSYKRNPDEYQAENELDNHWLPLFRKWMNAYKGQFDSIRPIRVNAQDKIEEDKKKTLFSQAKSAMEREDWLLAIELWSRLWPAVSGKDQEIVLASMLTALQKSARYGLYEKLQRSIIFSDLSDDFIYRQVKSLAAYYKKKSGDDALISLMSAFFVHKADYQSLGLLIKAYGDAGRWMPVLQLQMLLPQQLRSPDMLLLAALKTGWFSVFSDQFEKMAITEDDEIKWLLLQALYKKDYDKAEDYMEQAGDDYQAYLSILKSSSSIYQSIISGPKGQDSAAILRQWQALQKNLSMALGTEWRNNSEAVVSHGGRVNIQRLSDRLLLPYYYADAAHELHLQIAGPGKLRLQLRPLHNQSGQIQALNGSYQLYDGKHVHDFSINNNMPAMNWQLETEISGGHLLPGQRILQDLSLPAGIHNIRLRVSRPMLVRLQTEQPKLPVSRLPELNSIAMAGLISGIQHNQLPDNDYSFGDEWQSSTFQPMETEAGKELSRIALLLSAGSEQSDELIPKAEKIYYDSGFDPGLSALMARIRSFSHWDLADSILQSDGFWLKKLEEWQPETPAGRIFHALADFPPSAHSVLSNGRSIVLSLYNPRETTIELYLKALSPRFLAGKTLTFFYQIDDSDKVMSTVSGNVESVHITVPEGRHSIRLGLVQAPLYHRLWISIAEKDRGRVDLLKSRRYQLASAERPLVYAIQGPAWLRIDKYSNDTTKSRYRYIDEGTTTLRLTASEAEKNAFYRVFYRSKNQIVSRPLTIAYANEYIQSENLMKSSGNDKKLLKSRYSIKDMWHLGKQEDGTLSYQLGQISQDLLTDEPGTPADEYIQVDVSYRHYQDISRQWLYLSGLARYRQNGNTTLGVKSRLRGKFDAIPVDWTLDGSFYTQEQQTGREWSALIQMGLSQYRPINKYFYHLPKMKILARRLSSNEHVADSEADPDVFSNYKIDHQSSIRLSETLVYQPYNDMELYLKGERISNSRWLSTDQTRGRIGWRLLLANTRWDINYRQINYASDDNRILPLTRRILQTKLLLEKWVKPRYRLELMALLDKDIDEHLRTLKVQLSIHQSEGRAYRDFSPAELLFRRERSSTQLPELNNELN